MATPVVLQAAAYPEWDQTPLDAAFDVRRLFEAEDKEADLAKRARKCAPSPRGVGLGLTPR